MAGQEDVLLQALERHLCEEEVVEEEKGKSCGLTLDNQLLCRATLVPPCSTSDEEHRGHWRWRRVDVDIRSTRVHPPSVFAGKQGLAWRCSFEQLVVEPGSIRSSRSTLIVTNNKRFCFPDNVVLRTSQGDVASHSASQTRPGM